MRWVEIIRKLVELAEVVHRWLGSLSSLEPERRARIASYADAVADTLARAADALAQMEAAATPGERARARRAALRELGRLQGYVSTLVDVLKHHLDGRRLAGVKRRLEKLDGGALTLLAADRHDHRHLRIDRLHAAEGYFRALADGLRV